MNHSESGFATVKGIVAVPQHVPSAGAIVWWRLSGSVNYEDLHAAWVAKGLPEEELPRPCSNTVALRRAANDLREKRLLVRPLGRNSGFAIVQETVQQSRAGRGLEVETAFPVDEVKEALRYTVLVKLTLDEVGRPIVEKVDASDKRSTTIAESFLASFNTHLEVLAPEDFSSWLSRLMPKLDAVSLRDGGGVYFTPPPSQARLATVAEVLRAVTSHVVNRVPAMATGDAVAAILDAIEQEAKGEAARLQKDVEANELSERGFENRVLECQGVEDKVARYELLLGAKLDTLREQLETLRANLTVAALRKREEA